MIGMLAQTFSGGGGALSSQEPLGEMSKLRTSLDLCSKGAADALYPLEAIKG